MIASCKKCPKCDKYCSAETDALLTKGRKDLKEPKASIIYLATKAMLCPPIYQYNVQTLMGLLCPPQKNGDFSRKSLLVSVYPAFFLKSQSRLEVVAYERLRKKKRRNCPTDYDYVR